MTRQSNLGCLAAVTLMGCASVLDLPDDPVLVETGPWRCLGQEPPTTMPTDQTATVRVRACNFIDQCATTVSGLTAKLCAKADVGCQAPIAANVREEQGELRFEVPTSGFDGYLAVSSPLKRCTELGAASDALCKLATELQGCVLSDPTSVGCMIPSYAPAMLFFNPPIVADSTQPIELRLIPSSGFDGLLKAAGAIPNLTGGNMLVTARDCDGKPASGVTFTFSPREAMGTQLYLASGLPSSAAKQTDGSGVGGFVGIAAGLTGVFVEVSGYNSEGELIGKIGVQSAPGALTYGTVVPR